MTGHDCPIFEQFPMFFILIEPFSLIREDEIKSYKTGIFSALIEHNFDFHGDVCGSRPMIWLLSPDDT